MPIAQTPLVIILPWYRHQIADVHKIYIIHLLHQFLENVPANGDSIDQQPCRRIRPDDFVFQRHIGILIRFRFDESRRVASRHLGTRLWWDEDLDDFLGHFHEELVQQLADLVDLSFHVGFQLVEPTEEEALVDLIVVAVRGAEQLVEIVLRVLEIVEEHVWKSVSSITCVAKTRKTRDSLMRT